MEWTISEVAAAVAVAVSVLTVLGNLAAARWSRTHGRETRLQRLSEFTSGELLDLYKLCKEEVERLRKELKGDDPPG